jgi:hypothetical protein
MEKEKRVVVVTLRCKALAEAGASCLPVAQETPKVYVYNPPSHRSKQNAGEQ